MDRLDFDDIEVTYRQDGNGERVVLVHASPFVSWYRPLVERLPDFSTLRYRRRLHPSNDGRYRPLTVAEDAATCARLMDHVGWPTAHLVGHSYGALVALQAAMNGPRSVATVALLEPAARGVSSSPQVAAALEPVIAAYRSGDTAGALDGFLRHVCGADYRSVLDAEIPGAVDEARAEADLFFQAELAAVRDWSFGAGDAARITQPVLNVQGALSVQRFREASELVQQWFPDAEQLLVPGAGHFLMVQNATAVADGLRSFYSRHPIELTKHAEATT